MLPNKIRLFLSPVMSAFMALTGCFGNLTPVSSLNLVVAAVEVALPLIGPSAGLSPEKLAAYDKYLTQVSDFSVQATDILASSATSVDKAEKISAAFTAIVQPDLTGTPAKVLAVINKVIKAAADFMKTIPSPTVLGAAQHAGKPLALSASDVAKLPAVHARALALQAKIHAAGK